MSAQDCNSRLLFIYSAQCDYQFKLGKSAKLLWPVSNEVANNPIE